MNDATGHVPTVPPPKQEATGHVATVPAHGQRDGKLVAAQLVVTLLAGILAAVFAPHLDSSSRLKEFRDFFATSAQVIAAIFIALAIGAQFVVRRTSLAIVIVVSIAVSEISAVAALSPALSHGIYDWLFVLTVAGGVGALFAVVAIGVEGLISRLDEARAAELGLLLERLRQDRDADAACRRRNVSR